jgi:hypothetical protein
LSKFVRVAVAAVLVSGAGVACTAPAATAAPVYCSGHKATIVVGAKSARVVVGTAHNDVIAVTSGLHQVLGGGGNDILCADVIGTSLSGGDGNDLLVGAAGPDRLDGGTGNDMLLGGSGADTFIGGAGTDTVSYNDHRLAAVSAGIDGRADSGWHGEKDLIDLSVENLIGTPSGDLLTGSATHNILIGGTGNDRLVAGSGDDVLEGQSGDDTLTGQAGKDTLEGGSGSNVCDEDAADTVIGECRFDGAPPVVHNFELLTSHIDIPAGERDVSFRAEVTDNKSGVRDVSVTLCGPDTQPGLTAGTSLTLASGDSLDGVWQGTLKMSPYAVAGRWRVCYVNAADVAWNDVDYMPNMTDTDLHDQTLPGGEQTVDVVNSTAVAPVPVISNVSISTRSVDVTNGDVTITAEFTVNEVGADLNRVFFGMTYQGVIQFQNAQVELITPSSSGGAGSGRYRATLQLPQGSAAGTWKIGPSAIDEYYASTSALSNLTVADRNPITTLPDLISGSMTEGPFLRTHTFSLHFTSSRAALVNATVGIEGPSGQQGSAYLSLASGTPLDGIWTGTFTFPEAAAAGTWKAHDVTFSDALGREDNRLEEDSAIVRSFSFTVD